MGRAKEIKAADPFLLVYISGGKEKNRRSRCRKLEIAAEGGKKEDIIHI